MITKDRIFQNKDHKLISQAGVYLNPLENCPVSKNLKTIKNAKRAIRMAKNKKNYAAALHDPEANADDV